MQQIIPKQEKLEPWEQPMGTQLASQMGFMRTEDVKNRVEHTLAQWFTKPDVPQQVTPEGMLAPAVSPATMTALLAAHHRRLEKQWKQEDNKAATQVVFQVAEQVLMYLIDDTIYALTNAVAT